MPFYRFSLDVPAEVPIVAERLRAVIGNRHDSWIDGKSGPRFFGRMENNSFRIRRNIGYYRNSFLPRIRGRLTSSGPATRLNVAMWMNPLVLAFMLFWLTGVACAARISLVANSQTSPIPVFMFLFGLGLSLGGFFWEARKARTLLSNAVLNMAANDRIQVQGIYATVADTLKEHKRYSRVVLIIVAALTMIPTVLMLYQQRKHLINCPAFQESLAIVARSPKAKGPLGDHIEAAGFARGFVQDGKEFGYAMLSIPVQGSSGKGMVHVVANRVKGRWDLERVALWTDPEKQRIDLTPPTRREAFHYPAKGTVYLVPFDEQSADQLRALPAYYAARLGLQITVLPVMSLGPEAMDLKNHQILAERAVDFMERSSRKLNGEIDAVFLGVTSHDLTIKSSGWGHATNYRMTRYGIVSTARLRDMPLLAGANPEVFAIRVRKLVTKNLALLRYPVALSADPTSALATSVSTTNDVDKMSEEFLGERGQWMPIAVGAAPCYSVTQGPDGKQTWVEGCSVNPPNDNRFETFDNYTGSTSMVMSRTDFPVDDERRLSLVRKHWGKDDQPRTFGVGGNSSFSIYPVGDSDKFSWIDLIREDGGHIPFRRTSYGNGFANAKLQAVRQIGDPFSKSNLEWNGNGWDLKTIDGWTYQFPSSGPGRSSEQSALIGITNASRKVQIKRNASSGPERIEGLESAAINFKLDASNRIVEARHSAGHAIRYNYAPNGKLNHIKDSQTGDERYEYDEANRLTTVLDARGNAELSISYGYLGEITRETLADNRTIRFKYRFYDDRTLNALTVTDDQGFVTEWTRGQNGFYYQSLPVSPGK